MKVILSKQDSALLQDLYEQDGYQALVRFLEAARDEIAVDNMKSTTLEQLWTNRGRAEQIGWVLRMVQENYINRNKKG